MDGRRGDSRLTLYVVATRELPRSRESAMSDGKHQRLQRALHFCRRRDDLSQQRGEGRPMAIWESRTCSGQRRARKRLKREILTKKSHRETRRYREKVYSVS